MSGICEICLNTAEQIQLDSVPAQEEQHGDDQEALLQNTAPRGDVKSLVLFLFLKPDMCLKLLT